MSVKHKMATVTLTGVLAIRGASAAMAGNGDSADEGRSRPIATLCEHRAEIVPRLTARPARVAERSDRLRERSATATTEGRADRASRFERRIEALEARHTKLAERIAGAPAWIAEHCS